MKGDAQLDFLGRPPPPKFHVRVVLLPVGRELAEDPAGWDDALFEVEAGAVDVTLPSGSYVRFRAGDVFWGGLGRVRAASDAGCEPAVLVAVSRTAERPR
jgi:hypothetical protein